MRVDEIVSDIGEGFRELELEITCKKIDRVKIRFPRGVIRKARHFRNELFFIDDDVLQRNLAYHLMLTDFIRWVMIRFDIGLTIKEMLIKEGICLFGNICNAITTKKAGRKGFDPSLKVLAEKGIIGDSLKNDLIWLWGKRNKEHLQNLRDWEYFKYTVNDYNKAANAYIRLKTSLQKARQERKI